MKVVVIGGGMVGAAAAVALAQQGHQVTVIEAGARAVSEGDWDLRISSIHQQNVDWLVKLGTWPYIRAERRFPYTGLSVQSMDGVRVDFSHQDAGTPALGAMVENKALQAALWQQLIERQVPVYEKTSVVDYQFDQQQVTLTNGDQLNYDLLIGADGTQSHVAKAARIGYRGWDYDMRCLLAIAEVEHEVAATTWEIFRPQGPYALLPLGAHRVCLIDYRSERDWQELLALPEAELYQLLEAQFAPHIGSHRVLSHGSFPLRRQRALSYHAYQSVVLVGDAAHAIHPLAGQGVNLGFTDVQELVHQVCQLPLAQALTNYEQRRVSANQRMMRAMDMIHFGFCSQHVLPRGLVALGLQSVRHITPLKRALVLRAIGYA